MPLLAEIGAKEARSNYLNQCCFIDRWTIARIFQWDFNQHTTILTHENEFEHVIWKFAVILSWFQCVIWAIHPWNGVGDNNTNGWDALWGQPAALVQSYKSTDILKLPTLMTCITFTNEILFAASHYLWEYMYGYIILNYVELVFLCFHVGIYH